ncbi:MAG: DNA primase [Gammaproteobacteria bacterium]|nr:DNA primase [Gammaproteobacteria bacterium]
MAGQIPRQFIDDLLARADIVDVIEQYVPLRKAGHEWKALCPFHNEKTPSFTVSPQKQFYYCFGCGASGSAIGFLMEHAHMDFPEAVAELAGRVGLAVPAGDEGDGRPRANLAPLYDALAESQRWFARQLREHPQGQRAIDYLKGRGLTGEIAATFGIGYAPPGWDNLLRALGSQPESAARLADAGLLIPRSGGHYDRFRDRIMFPIHDQRGRVVGFGGRVLGDEEPKYLNSPETPVFHKGHELYGLYQARRAEPALAQLIVVEGYMDVVALAQHGVGNAVATLGTATTREHLERVFRVVSDVVFCFDGDTAGRRAAWRALEAALPLLHDGRSVGFLFMPQGEDPDSLVRRQGPALFTDRNAAVPLAEYMFERLAAQVNLATVDGRSRLVELARPLIEQLPSVAARQPLAERLGDLTGFRPDPRPGGRPCSVPTRPQVRERSLVRTAITLLLHRPDLAATAPPAAELRGAGLPGLELLTELIEFARGRPQVSGGVLLEHWRDSPHGEHLTRLLGSAPEIPADGYAAEFAGALEKLRALALKVAQKQVVTNARPSELSDREKAELRARFGGRKEDPPSA